MQTTQLNVTGMTCGGCVSNDNITPTTGEVLVKSDEQIASTAQLKSAVQRAGFGVDDSNNTTLSTKAAELDGKIHGKDSC